VFPLAVFLSAAIAGIALDHVREGRPPWHTWLVSLGIIAGVSATIAAFVWVGRQLPS
jgi:hypothetical protein